MSEEKESLSIWFFVGLILTIYGIIVLIANIQALISPPVSTHVVFENLHSGLWWGGMMILLGLLFLYLHWPGMKQTGGQSKSELNN